MTNVIALNSSQPTLSETQQDIVDRLETALADAKLGVLTAVVVVALRNTGNTQSGYACRDENLAQLLGAVEISKARLLKNWTF